MRLDGLLWAGSLRSFFDRCYNDLKGKTEGLPVIYYIRAGLDGEGCKVALNKILTGLRWRQVLPPLILKGSWQEDYLKQLEKYLYKDHFHDKPSRFQDFDVHATTNRLSLPLLLAF